MVPQFPSPRAALAAVLILAGAAAGAAGAADPHYERLERQGIFALQKGDPGAAVRDLRLACFGYLSEPPQLAECLGYLALAEAAAGEDDGFERTFQRLVGLEERFGAVGEAELPPETAAKLAEEIRRRVPAEVLADIRLPGLLARASAAEEAPAAAEPEPPRSSPPAASAPTRDAAAAETTPPDAAATDRPEPRTGGAATFEPAPDEPPASSAASDPLGAEARGRLERARELLARARVRRDLAEAYRLAREVADAHEGAREAQHLAALIAYRSARWHEAADYFARGGEPGDPAMLFYYAVALYESGDRETAAEILHRALPGLERSAFVSSYEERILGATAPPPPSSP